MPYGVGAFFAVRPRLAAGGPARRPVGPAPDDAGVLLRHGRRGAARRATRDAWQLAAALTLLGAFASIYHPVGIPMLVQRRRGQAARSASTASPATWASRVAAVRHRPPRQVRGLARGVRRAGAGLDRVRNRVRARAPARAEAPAQRSSRRRECPAPASLARVFLVMTVASVTGSLLFNFTTNGNGELLRERFAGIVEDPATLGVLLAVVYALGLVRAARRRRPDRPRAAQVPVRGHRRARRCRCSSSPRSAQGWCALRADDRLHGRGVRRDPVHRRDDRPLRRRPHALARLGHAPDRVVRRELARRLAARAGGQGGGLRRAVLVAMAAIAAVTATVVLLLPAVPTTRPEPAAAT